jgi:predicted unusual protein kinase regulating ubiquinone biosynthesis (AarF/ABC1/UbiB family)
VIGYRQSARQIRAQYYCERAATLRSRVRSLPFEDVSSELSHLATEYERLADYLQLSETPVRAAADAQVHPGRTRRS